MESVDLYLIHWPGVQGLKPNDERNPELRRQSWSDMERLYEQGRCSAVSLCIHLHNFRHSFGIYSQGIKTFW